MTQRVRITNRLSQSKVAAGSRREIPGDFKYNKKKLKHLKRILHNVSVAVGTLVSAVNEFSRIKGPDISPDGNLGGLGYILPIKDIKEVLNTSIRGLSDVSDSIADELTNPNWGAEDDSDVKKLIKEKEDIEEKAENSHIIEEDEDDSTEDDSTEESPVPEVPVENDDGDLSNKDVVTSQDVIKQASTDDFFSKAVRESLVRFSSVGRKNL